MAAATRPLPPPPGAGDDVPDSPSPGETSTQDAGTGTPAQASPASEMGTRMVLNVVRDLRAIAKAYPAASPAVHAMLEQVPKVQKAMFSSVKAGEPAAPPNS